MCCYSYPLHSYDRSSVNDKAEYQQQTDPRNTDTDSDRMSDGYEINHGKPAGGWQELHWYNKMDRGINIRDYTNHLTDNPDSKFGGITYEDLGEYINSNLVEVTYL